MVSEGGLKKGAPFLSVREVKKHFGRFAALRGASFEVDEGDFLAVVGPNGAGKSTLFNCLTLNIRPSSGDILFRGNPVSAIAQRYRSQMGTLSHQLFLYDDLTGEENLLFFAGLYSVPAPRERVEQSLVEFDLWPHRARLVRAYSRGMRQRLALARALIHGPDLILLDEPFTGLDQHAAHRLKVMLEELKRRRRTVLLISHQLEHASELGDRVLIIHQGRICRSVIASETTFSELSRLYLEIFAAR